MRIFIVSIIFILFAWYATRICRPLYSEKDKLINQVNKRTALALKQELDLRPFGFGSQAMYQIKMLELSFQYHHPIDIAEGRDLLIRATQKFLDEINSSEKIRPYLDHYPFEPNDVSILILLQKPDGREVAPGELTLISAREGGLEYDIYDAKRFLETVHKETYEEAVQKLHVQEDALSKLEGSSLP